ncbi:NADH dehydrogenase subunit J [Stackebrandtia albiflava]|uniref:NADH-quinone oxidoreductase subunit J n=1 Tax=Stackebrandtia albiflava TaxID=406432 RepID=A0A562UY66_9ACTN|nr:NADH-quinone oxidoreductase subunit J [Stackebrandtia albiflava]TWJ10571.1 NADH dehydrogenase subunit J [Stackebrandtia albiflava]
MTVTDVLLCVFGAVTLAAAVRVVTTAHLVRAGLWLVVALGGLAACFLVLTAELVAWVQVLIYVGAVVVLLLFAVMLTRAPIGAHDRMDRRRWPAALVGAAAGAGLAAVLIEAFRWRWVDMAEVEPGGAERMGAEVFGSWVLPFELLSVLLLSALIGAIVISVRRRAEAEPDG